MLLIPAVYFVSTKLGTGKIALAFGAVKWNSPSPIDGDFDMFGTPVGAGGMPKPKAGGIFGTPAATAPAPAPGLPAAQPFGTKIAATAPGGLFAAPAPAAAAAFGTPAAAPVFGTPGMRGNSA